MISRFFETAPRATERGQNTGKTFYRPDQTNQIIVFVFDFQVKKDSKVGFIAFELSLLK